jgi:hypothetical protein
MVRCARCGGSFFGFLARLKWQFRRVRRCPSCQEPWSARSPLIIGMMSGVSSLMIPLAWILAGQMAAFALLLVLVVLTEVFEFLLGQPPGVKKRRGVN